MSFSNFDRISKTLIFILSFLLLSNVFFLKADDSTIDRVIPGVEVLLSSQLDVVKGKRVGLITNPTGITSDFVSTIDALHQNSDVKLTALFGPEHGVRGDIEAGERVIDYIDSKTGVKVYSLYGKTRKPTRKMLENVDILVYDIQDIGSRAYTYIYTMAYAMEAARENGIPFVVLDRPNPLGGNRVEGNVLDPKFSSFIGLYPIAYVYGMTVGELAKLFNTEYNINCDLVVIPMKKWRRDMVYADTGLPWIMTSPHVPYENTCTFVSATGCIGELGTLSVGVGYTMPFKLIGAPWIDSHELTNLLNNRKLKGVHFRPISYKPYYSTFKEEYCNGFEIHITDPLEFSPQEVQIHILTAINELYPQNNIFDTHRISSFDRAYGSDQIRLNVLSGLSANQIISRWQKDLEKFKAIRSKYLLY